MTTDESPAYNLDDAIAEEEVFDVTPLAVGVGLSPNVPIILSGPLMAAIQDGWAAVDTPDGGFKPVAEGDLYDTCRIWHVLTMLLGALRTAPDTHRVAFTALIGGEEWDLCAVFVEVEAERFVMICFAADTLETTEDTEE